MDKLCLYRREAQACADRLRTAKSPAARVRIAREQRDWLELEQSRSISPRELSRMLGGFGAPFAAGRGVTPVRH